MTFQTMQAHRKTAKTKRSATNCFDRIQNSEKQGRNNGGSHFLGKLKKDNKKLGNLKLSTILDVLFIIVCVPGYFV